MNNKMNADEFYVWFAEITGSNERILFMNLDRVFGTQCGTIYETRKAILDSGMQGEELLEYIDSYLKL